MARKGAFPRKPNSSFALELGRDYDPSRSCHALKRSVFLSEARGENFMSDLFQLRELIARSCRVLGKLNLTKEPSGHVSARVPGTDRILIKARGPEESGLRFVTAEDIITVDMAGKKIEGPDGLETPQEVFIHTWLYRTRPEVQSVVHVHPLTV